MRLLSSLICCCFILSMASGCAKKSSSESCADGLREGKELLQVHRLAEAKDKFACVVANEPNNLEANFWYAMTRALNLSTNASIANLIERFGGHGDLSIWNWSLEFPHPQAEQNPTFFPNNSPSFAEVVSTSEEVALPEIDGALKNLLKVEQLTSFTTVIPADAFPRRESSSDTAHDIRVDISDIYYMEAQLSYYKAMIHFLKGYNLEGDSDAALNDSCFSISTFLVSNPDFIKLTSNNLSEFVKAKESLRNYFTAYRLFLDSVLNETHDQANDLFTIESTTQAVDKRDWCTRMLNSLDQPAEMEIGEGDNRKTVTIYLGRLFDTPLSRIHLPQFYFDESTCTNQIFAGTFPDPTFRGLFPDFGQQDAYDFFNGYVTELNHSTE